MRMISSLAVVAGSAATLAACAAGPSDPSLDRTVVVYVPAAAGSPARLERVEIPGRTFRPPPPPAPIGPDQTASGSRTVAGDASVVLARLTRALASGEVAYPDVLDRLGPPPPADSPAVVTEATFATRRCADGDGEARLAEVWARTCPTESDLYTDMTLQVGSASLEIGAIRRDLAAAGYRDLGPTAPNLNLHPPRPDTFSVFVREDRAPTIVVNHLREGPPREASVMRVSLYWAGGPAR